MNPYLIALSQFGTKGFSGVLHNPEVLKYFRDIGQTWVKDDETAWCAAFVSWCLTKAGKRGINYLAARTFLNYGEQTTKPIIGDLVVLWRVNRNSPYGHVGFFVCKVGPMIYILGGNQSNEVNITAFPETQLLGYRKIPE